MFNKEIELCFSTDPEIPPRIFDTGGLNLPCYKDIVLWWVTCGC